MESFNYRLVLKPHKDFPSFYLREVYYKSNYEIESWTENHLSPFGESINELLLDLDKIKDAVKNKPCLLEINDKLIEAKGFLIIWEKEKVN